MICYGIYYTGNFVYDIFFKKDRTDFLPIQEDEEVDISDEAGQFKPIFIDKDMHNGRNGKPNVAGHGKEGKAKRENLQTDSSQGDDPPSVPTTETADDEPPNRKSLSDVGPKEPDAKEKEHIRELVKQTRVKLENERKQEGQETDKPRKPENPQNGEMTTKTTVQQPQNKPKEDRKIPRYEHISNDSLSSAPKKHKTATKELRDDEDHSHKLKIVQPEKPRAPLARFDFYVDIDEDAQKTKLCGGRTAEAVQDEFKGMPLDQVKMAIEKMNKFLQLTKLERKLTEEEIEAMESSKNTTRAPLANFDF